MIEPELATPSTARVGDEIGPRATQDEHESRWEARRELARHRADTERLRVLVDFLARPVCAHGGPDPDPDIVTAYNLAVEAALQGIRRAASGEA